MRVESGGLLEGFKVEGLGSSSLTVSHLLFTDDRIFFFLCGAKEDELHIFLIVLVF